MRAKETENATIMSWWKQKCLRDKTISCECVVCVQSNRLVRFPLFWFDLLWNSTVCKCVTALSLSSSSSSSSSPSSVCIFFCFFLSLHYLHRTSMSMYVMHAIIVVQRLNCLRHGLEQHLHWLSTTTGQCEQSTASHLMSAKQRSEMKWEIIKFTI